MRPLEKDLTEISAPTQRQRQVCNLNDTVAYFELDYKLVWQQLLNLQRGQTA